MSLRCEHLYIGSIFLILPAHSNYKLYILDLSFCRPVKTFYRATFDAWMPRRSFKTLSFTILLNVMMKLIKHPQSFTNGANFYDISKLFLLYLSMVINKLGMKESPNKHVLYHSIPNTYVQSLPKFKQADENFNFWTPMWMGDAAFRCGVRWK